MSIGRLRGQSSHEGDVRASCIANEADGQSRVHRKEIIRILGVILDN